MRAVLLALMVMLSGCAVQYESHHETQTSSQNSCTQNGEPCERWTTPTGPNETVAINERVPLTQGLDQEWRFSVHPGASNTSVRLHLAGYEGQAAGLGLGKGCARLQGPGVNENTGHCTGGGTSIGVNPVYVTPAGDNGAHLSRSDLGVGNYALSLDIGPTAADLVVEIHVDY